MKLNQKGMTLVELIAALALASLVGVIAWTALSIGMEHGTVETSKTKMQQDANLIITKLAAAHRKSDYYNLTFQGNELIIESCQDDGICEEERIEKKYDYSGTEVNNIPVGEDFTIPYTFADLKPKNAHTEITLRIADVNKQNRKIAINTKLTRILTNLN